jgi:hypothetical protein
VGVRLLRRCEARQCAGAAPRVIVATQGAVDCATLRPGGLGQPLRPAVTVGVVGALLPTRRQVVRALGVLAMGQPRRALPPAVEPAPAPGARRTPLGGRDRGLGEPAPAPEPRAFVRGHPGVVRCATMAGFPSEGRPEDAGHPCPLPPGRPPIPRAKTGDRAAHILPLGGHDREAGHGAGRAVVRPQALPSLVQAAAGQRPGVAIAPTIRLRVLGGKSQEILCRRTGHTHGAIVKLLEAFFPKKERCYDHRNPDPHDR